MSEINSPNSERAGLYVLGLVRGAERRAFEAEMATNRSLASEVAAWEARFLPLALAVEPVPPPGTVWIEIQRILTPHYAAVTVPIPRRRHDAWIVRERVWNNLLLWRGIGGLALAAAILLAVFRPQPPASAHMVAVLSGKMGPTFTVAMRPDGGMNIASVGHFKPPPGKVWQLWAVAGGEKPVAIGFVKPGGGRLPPNDMPATLRKPQILIAVTVEPPGGAPGGQPDTPIVFSGPLLPMNSPS